METGKQHLKLEEVFKIKTKGMLKSVEDHKFWDDVSFQLKSQRCCIIKDRIEADKT